MWTYYINEEAKESEKPITSKDFAETSDETKMRCLPGKDVATPYKSGKVMNYTGGMCGTKYQITNSDADYVQDFKVLKDAASRLTIGTLALALPAAFLLTQAF